MDDLIVEFLTETNEGLAALATDLIRLEREPQNKQALGSIFRVVHTIKGTCGFLGLSRLERVAHAAENVLGQLRDGHLAVSPPLISIIFEGVDRIREIVVGIETSQAEPEGDDGELTERLDRAARGELDAAAAAIVEACAAVEAPRAPAVSESAEPKAAERAGDAGEARPAEAEASSAHQTIRVNVALLETLMTTVSELVLTRNQLMQILRGQKDSEFAGPLQRLSQVTTELQDGVMKTRMQPIGNAWAKLPRLVRDLNLELGKRIELVMLGAETELDRQILEMIRDPLTHMVRNSADHGVETPAERVAAGKSESGRITLNAFHEGGHIVVEVGDDGRGLAVDKIRKKALENGLATEADLAQMSEQQIQQFIFKAGFSTAAQVTSVSGRGVGMDVVRTNIERIGGTVELRSADRRGTTFVIKIPLTLAIVSALIVECGGERFAIPQIGIVELVRVSGQSENRIERLNKAPVLRLRERLLPLVPLHELLRLPRQESASDEGFVIVSQVGTYTFGIIVDRVFDTEEIVVKPVAPLLRDIPIFSGNTILGDGRVVMILDMNGIAATTGELMSESEAARSLGGEASEESGERTSLLLFRAGDDDPKAVPLALVSRLEDIDTAQIEHAAGRAVLQYRNRLMPLVTLDGAAPEPGTGAKPVLVFSDRDRTMGLVVDEIIDIVEARLSIELGGSSLGCIGTAIVANRSTDLIDVGFYFSRAFDGWSTTGRGAATPARRRVLVIDESPFFRNLLAPVLTTAGYRVSFAASAAEAIALCGEGAEFDLILADVDTPEVARISEAIQSSESWSGTPVVGLTENAGDPGAVDLGAGFRGCVAKADRMQILSVLSTAIDSERQAA